MYDTYNCELYELYHMIEDRFDFETEKKEEKSLHIYHKIKEIRQQSIDIYYVR